MVARDRHTDSTHIHLQAAPVTSFSTTGTSSCDSRSDSEDNSQCSSISSFGAKITVNGTLQTISYAKTHCRRSSQHDEATPPGRVSSKPAQLIQPFSPRSHKSSYASSSSLPLLSGLQIRASTLLLVLLCFLCGIVAADSSTHVYAPSNDRRHIVVRGENILQVGRREAAAAAHERIPMRFERRRATTSSSGSGSKASETTSTTTLGQSSSQGGKHASTCTGTCATNSPTSSRGSPTGSTTEKRSTMDSSTSSTKSSTSSLLAAPSSSSTALPRAFDTSLGSNFTDPKCETFFYSFLQDAAFIDCHPLSLLLQTSKSFFDVSKSLVSLTETLDASCGVDFNQCTSVMKSLTRRIKSEDACRTDLSLGNPLVSQALNGFVAYQSMYQAGCLKDAEGSYCFADAITNFDSPTDSFIYYLPSGLPLPAGTRPTCNSCLRRTMAVFASAASDPAQPISKVYSSAAQQVNVACGPEFAKAAVAALPKNGGAATANALPGTGMLILTLAVLASLLFT